MEPHLTQNVRGPALSKEEAGEAWKEVGAAPSPSHGRPVDQTRENAGFYWEKMLQLWPQPCPSIPVMERMLLAEIPKMLLLLFSQSVDQLAPVPAPAFAHSENSSLSAFKSQIFQQEVVLSIHTPGLGDSALRQKQVAVKQASFTSCLYDRQLKFPGRDFAP